MTGNEYTNQHTPTQAEGSAPARGGESRSQRLGNSVVRGILRSPLHRMLSGRLLVISVTGRKTGKRYRNPVGYVEHDGAILIGTAGKWRRNLPANPEVTVLLRGKRRQATAEVITDEERCTGLYRPILAKNPVHGKYAGIGIEPDGSPNPADLHAALKRGIAVVRLNLQPTAAVTGIK
jgi:deazaflavin-dependent oxidoreductase (nitroreductase family)